MILLSACDLILNVVKTAYLPVGAAATAAAPVPVSGEPYGSHRGPVSGRRDPNPGGRWDMAAQRLGNARATPDVNSATARPRPAPCGRRSRGGRRGVASPGAWRPPRGPHPGAAGGLIPGP